MPSSPDGVTHDLVALYVGGETNDFVWYPDYGVVSHMTSQDGKLSNVVPSNGSSYIVVRDGTRLPMHQ